MNEQTAPELLHRLRAQLNGLLGALIGQGNRVCDEMRDAIAYLDTEVRPAVVAAARARAELEFVAERYRRDGSGVRFSKDRCTGVSSDALAWFAAGARPEPERHEYPADRSDLAACERTFHMAPPHLQERMLPVLERYRAAVAKEIGQ
ncbi:hypothetical protein [Amycolatopsis thermophila]|uniref:Uncharacterized protein n=1 Tax=Amycolatopsis thermophila TaxID=206084 RepID=A0ABU0EMN8_9PSEU|nr:hypothetical protein [Amycolatopsis thermophila]MDQ0376541.1 hypothetical protein [Amycolatopsis thermophila]